jgi:hypothetical protein
LVSHNWLWCFSAAVFGGMKNGHVRLCLLWCDGARERLFQVLERARERLAQTHMCAFLFSLIRSHVFVHTFPLSIFRRFGCDSFFRRMCWNGLF